MSHHLILFKGSNLLYRVPLKGALYTEHTHTHTYTPELFFLYLPLCCFFLGMGMRGSGLTLTAREHPLITDI